MTRVEEALSARFFGGIRQDLAGRMRFYRFEGLNRGFGLFGSGGDFGDFVFHEVDAWLDGGVSGFDHQAWDGLVAGDFGHTATDDTFIGGARGRHRVAGFKAGVLQSHACGIWLLRKSGK